MTNYFKQNSIADAVASIMQNTLEEQKKWKDVSDQELFNFLNESTDKRSVAYQSAMDEYTSRKKKVVSESEQIDELSSKTLHSYASKRMKQTDSNLKHPNPKKDKMIDLANDKRWKKNGISKDRFLKTIGEDELDEGFKNKVSPHDAHAVLKKHGSHKDANFFSLNSSQVSGLVDHGKSVGYRKGKNAPGSYGRMYHDALQRHASKVKMNEDELDEASTYDPITKKMVAVKRAKVKMGGTVTKDGKEIKTGPSKKWAKIPKTGPYIKEDELDEGNRMNKIKRRRWEADLGDDKSPEEYKKKPTNYNSTTQSRAKGRKMRNKATDKLTNEGAMKRGDDLETFKKKPAGANPRQGVYRDEKLAAKGKVSLNSQDNVEVNAKDKLKKGDKNPVSENLKTESIITRALNEYRSRQGMVLESKMSTDARELELYIENDADLYRQQTTPIQKNLTKKHAAGKYDSKLAQKLWRYLVDNGAKKYVKEFGGPGDKAAQMFPGKVRDEVAASLEASWKDELDAGNGHK